MLNLWNSFVGVANSVTCPSGLIYDDYAGTCTWPDSAQRKGCEKGAGKKGIHIILFSDVSKIILSCVLVPETYKKLSKENHL